MNKLLPLLALALLGCGSATQNAPAEPRPPAVDTIDTAQLLTLLKPGNKTPVIVNFWATWCPPCEKEMPELSEFYRSHAAANLRFLSISVDHPDTLEDRVRPFVLKHALPFPVHVLTERSPENVSKALGVEWTGAVPATLLFDKTGKLAKSWFEETTRQELEKALESL